MENPNAMNVEGDTVVKVPDSIEGQQTLSNIEVPAIDPEAPYGRKVDGTPMKKRGRKTGSVEGEQFARLDSVTRAPPKPQQSQTTTPIAPIAVDYDALSRLAATLWFEVPQPLFGSDWAPTGKDEANGIALAFKRYFIAQGITEINPTLALMLSLGSYTLARANKPSFKQRFTGLWSWIKSKTKL